MRAGIDMGGNCLGNGVENSARFEGGGGSGGGVG